MYLFLVLILLDWFVISYFFAAIILGLSYAYLQFRIVKKLGHSKGWMAFVPVLNWLQILQMGRIPIWVSFLCFFLIFFGFSGDDLVLFDWIPFFVFVVDYMFILGSFLLFVFLCISFSRIFPVDGNKKIPFALMCATPLAGHWAFWTMLKNTHPKNLKTLPSTFKLWFILFTPLWTVLLITCLYYIFVSTSSIIDLNFIDGKIVTYPEQ